MTLTQFQVNKADLSRTRCVSLTPPPLAAGQVRVRLQRFAYTANNVTYAAFGEAMGYWRFFPALEPEAAAASVASAASADWGVVPVWGFAVVQQSLHPGVAVGERLYGFWPMASHAILKPKRLSENGFVDGAEHRAALHAVYNQYTRCSRDAYYTADSEDAQALLRPLFTTAWLIDDFLADNEFFGARASSGLRATPRARLLLSSASSKTAYATASQLARRDDVELVGLTSARNLAFCESLGVYHRVVDYEQLDTLDPDVPCVYVDFAGNSDIRLAIHGRFSRLAYSCSIGGTHVEKLAGARDVPGPKPTLFFAPAQIKKRVGEWGAASFSSRLVDAWHGFRAQATSGARPWMVVQEHAGFAAAAVLHQQVLTGQGDARLGHVVRLN